MDHYCVFAGFMDNAKRYEEKFHIKVAWYHNDHISKLDSDVQGVPFLHESKWYSFLNTTIFYSIQQFHSFPPSAKTVSFTMRNCCKLFSENIKIICNGLINIYIYKGGFKCYFDFRHFQLKFMWFFQITYPVIATCSMIFLGILSPFKKYLPKIITRNSSKFSIFVTFVDGLVVDLIEIFFSLSRIIRRKS